ncbi:MAG: DUF4405 domain-containing protein [Anaerolineales bacterium]|nr:DUF4405 domain-containing protein [Anaerolineales bacterium]
MSKQTKIKLTLDILTFVAFLISMDPRTSGIPVHEWLTIALAATLVVHLLLNWNWIVEITNRLFAKGKGMNGARVNYVLNWALFIDGVLIMLSGVMISQAVAPALGFTMPEDFSWRGLHEVSTNLSMLLMGLHVALHWSWFVSTVKRLFARKESQPIPASAFMNEKDAQA